MKNIKFIIHFKQVKMAAIATIITGIALVLVGSINNVNYNKSTSGVEQNSQVFSSVYATQYGVTTPSILSVRSGAGTNYSVVGSMKSGTKVIITGNENNFYKITFEGNTGYISAQYVKITAKPVIEVKPSVVEPDTTQYGVTTSNNLSVRSGAGANYSVVGSIKSGTKVEITGNTNNFYKINFAGNTGYISAQYVKLTAKPFIGVKPTVVVPYATKYGVTTSSNLSVRSGAGTNYSVVGSMKSGTKVIITGNENNFYKITYNGKTGYISGQYVKITANPASI